MKLHEKPIFPKGFSCASIHAGIKKEGKDLSVFFSEKPCTASAVFTRNQCPGAPIIVGREIVKGKMLQAIIVNSKISNVGTGEAGVRNARRMGVVLADELDIPAKHVLMSSTGIIGKPLPIELIEKGVIGIGRKLQNDPMVGAEGIMTTDTHPKAISMSVGKAVLTIVAKGAGMIEPNMATLLVYIFTDAEISWASLDKIFKSSINKTLNMLSVDTDTSTSDTCALLANGLAGKADPAKFAKALEFAMTEITKILARDGEGATKLLIAEVKRAFNDREAKFIAKSIVNSPLIKTMAYGCDPNIGRILMAVGKCFDCKVQIAKLSASINGTLVYRNQQRVDFDEVKVRKLLSSEEIKISVDLGVGKSSATAYGCDFTEGYIKENAAYYSS